MHQIQLAGGELHYLCVAVIGERAKQARHYQV